MAFNPFHSFRKYKKTMFAILAIVWTTKIGTAYWWGTNYDSYAGGAGQQWLACQGCAWTPVVAKDFAFKTWVGTAAANQPPAVAADHPSISVTEGTAMGNTGSYSDPDGDAVTLTASSGSTMARFTPTGASPSVTRETTAAKRSTRASAW